MACNQPGGFFNELQRPNTTIASYGGIDQKKKFSRFIKRNGSSKSKTSKTSPLK